MIDLLARLRNARPTPKGWTARCPAHEDRHNSLSIAHRNGRWLLKCYAGCEWRAIVDALGIDASELFEEPREGETPPGSHAHKRTSAQSLTLSQYANTKRLPLDFLKGCGLADFRYCGKPAVRIPYLGRGGEQLAARFRIALDGDRFRWKAGSKPCLYGLNRLADARKANSVALVEGESDCHTLWYHNIPALGVPGASNWHDERDAAHLEGIETIYIVVEPDHGGDTVRRWLAQSTIRHRARLLTLPAKDPSALHVEQPDRFRERWQVACFGAVPWTAVEAKANEEARCEAWQQCVDLAQRLGILDAFDADLSRVGVVGERRAARLLYLAVTSRLLDRPVSIAVKGPSSGGKSFIVESVLKFFPQEAFYALTAMSEHALAYDATPLNHRHLVVYEAAGLQSDLASYLMRSLLSEGRVDYVTVEKTKDGLKSRRIEREGPTGLIVTTTQLHLHPENETRMLSLTVSDTREQTAAVFRALAKDLPDAPDLSQWHALQTWLATGPNEVAIPFAEALAELVPPAAVRLRRDFKTLLTLIRAHALLHQATRQKDDDGRIVATVDDYVAIRELAADWMAQGVGAAVKPETREVVKAVGAVIASGREHAGTADLEKLLKLDRSAISRRVKDAVAGKYLRNLEERKRQPARLVPGDPLPEGEAVLPERDALVHLCSCESGGAMPSPSSVNGDGRSDDGLEDDRRCGQCGEDDGETALYHGGLWFHRVCRPFWLRSQSTASQAAGRREA
jgi:hypothetical protein